MRLLSIVPIVLALNANLALPQNQHYFADFVGNASGPVYATTDRYEGSAGGMYWIDQNCQGQSMLFFRKGLGVFPGGPGGSEDHFLESGFWKQISEITYSQANWGQMLPDHRVFRDDATMRKGYIRFPEAIPQSGSYRVIPSFWEERWDLTCYATTHTTFAGSVFSASDAVYDESFGMSVTDCRSPVRKAGKCGTTPIPVSFWQHVEFWWGGGGVNIEIYKFGRWHNPETGQLEGLGLIEWTHGGPAFDDCPDAADPCVGPSTLIIPGVDPSIPCVTCPDP